MENRTGLGLHKSSRSCLQTHLNGKKTAKESIICLREGYFLWVWASMCSQGTAELSNCAYLNVGMCMQLRSTSRHWLVGITQLVLFPKDGHSWEARSLRLRVTQQCFDILEFGAMFPWVNSCVCCFKLLPAPSFIVLEWALTFRLIFVCKISSRCQRWCRQA